MHCSQPGEAKVLSFADGYYEDVSALRTNVCTGRRAGLAGRPVPGSVPLTHSDLWALFSHL